MRKAFTLLELVFVIVVIGILAAMIIPSTRTNPVAEAAIQLQSHIRYAQHLAMVDDKFDTANSNWYKNLWQIAFNGNQYSIVANNNGLFAKDPLTQNDMQNIDLNADFGITSITYSGGCAAEKDISFGHLGRPITGDLNAATSHVLSLGGLLTAACVITLTNGSETETITISPETGYTRR